MHLLICLIISIYSLIIFYPLPHFCLLLIGVPRNFTSGTEGDSIEDLLGEVNVLKTSPTNFPTDANLLWMIRGNESLRLSQAITIDRSRLSDCDCDLFEGE